MRHWHRLLPLAVLVILSAAACGGPATQGAASPDSDEQSAATAPASPTATASAAALPPIEDVAYGDDDRHVLDIHLPGGVDGPHPTILAIHGGGFYARSKDFYDRIGPLLAERGFAFVAMSYRLAPTHTYPAQVEDAFCALAWVHANHERYGFDPARVAAWGGSAGGYLAAMLGTVDDPARYLDGCAHDEPADPALTSVAVFYGLFDFTDLSDYPPSGIPTLERFWGAQRDELSDERLAEMSPIAQIDGSEPPFILLHGTWDVTIPSIMSERFAAALEDAGVEVELVLVEEAGHAFEPLLRSETMSSTLATVTTFLGAERPR